MNERLLVFIVAVILIAAVLFLVFGRDSMTSQQFFVIRLVVALGAAGFGALLPGFLNVTMSVATNIVIRGGGAISLFLVVFLVNPPVLTPSITADVENRGIEHDGFLGTLYDHLDGHVGTEVFSLILQSGDEEQLRDLFIEPTVGGTTWGELFLKICKKYSCIKCDPAPTVDSRRVVLSVGDRPLQQADDGAVLERKRLKCP